MVDISIGVDHDEVGGLLVAVFALEGVAIGGAT